MTENKKIALITGVTGFIGSHLAVRLINEGWQVNAIIRTKSNTDKLQKQCKDKIVFYVHDENHDLNQIIQKTKPTIVFHLASLFLSQHQYENISDLIDSNIKFGTELLEAMIQNKVYSFINTGTSWQHYQNDDYNPVNLYAASKQAFECMIRYYQETASLNVITLKLFDTYGPNDARKKLFSLLQEIEKTGRCLAMSKGEQLIDLVYIDDVIEAYMLAAKRLLKGEYTYAESYSISSGKPVCLKNIVEIYENLLGEKLNIDWGGRCYRKREVMIPWNKGKSLENWQITICIESGIKRILKMIK